MTNYNERLDELMPCDCKFLKGFAWRKGDPCEGCINGRLKQAITSLIKELVAEAKQEKLKESDYVLNMVLPHNPPSDTTRTNLYRKGYNDSLDQFEQNLLKELEEV